MPSNPVVMVIDDSLMIRNMVKRALMQANYAVVEAKDGQDAVEKLVAGTAPDLIVCDVNMPRMNGLELLEWIASQPAITSPIVMLTTEGQPELVRKARLLGAKGWLVKPFKADLLLAAAEKLIAAGV
tara:strand:+ start:203 stop:583 length:381 start_codon:yes stop_codon:yes gene_type:complete